MKRVVVTGMGIVSSIGNNAQEVLASLREAKSGIVQAPTNMPSSVSAARSMARPSSTGKRMIDRARRFMGEGAAWNYSPWSRPSAMPGLRRKTSPTSAPASSWARVALDPHHRRRPPTSRAKRAPSASARLRCRRPCARPTRRRFPPPSDQGRQLFDLIGLRDLGPLHRQWRRAHPVGQAGHHVRRRRRGARLDLVRPLRRHGRHVVRFQRPPEGPAAPMTRTATASSSPAAPAWSCSRSSNTPRPAAPDLWRDRRLRRHLRRLRHGAALRRGRGPLHEHGHAHA